ncbi:MAG: Gfo/Idh/MocA family oxidoreductase [candidate division Zixibacteria bacterium]|nr:Gfo/Idh/MocA family oxidoreductase [candidate division Zixibacteria bacterium]
MNKIRTAVIGVGHLGRHHARWYKSIKDSELVGVYDSDPEKCRQVAGDLGIIAFAAPTDLLGKVDAVSVVVPTGQHFEVAGIFLRERIHCLVEKPITATVKQAEELITIATGNRAILTVGHIERFNPAIQALKKYQISPRFIEAHRLAVFDPRGTDVAVVLDLMIHDIDLALHLVKSSVKRIEASAIAVISDTADIANARLTFENGAVANLTASRISLHAMRKLRIFQKSGYFSLDLAERQADIYQLADKVGGDDGGMRFPLGKSGRDIVYHKAGNKDDDMLCQELTAFVKAIKENSLPEVTGAEALEALRVAVEIEKVGLTGAIV